MFCIVSCTLWRFSGFSWSQNCPCTIDMSFIIVEECSTAQRKSGVISCVGWTLCISFRLFCITFPVDARYHCCSISVSLLTAWIGNDKSVSNWSTVLISILFSISIVNQVSFHFNPAELYYSHTSSLCHSRKYCFSVLFIFVWNLY